MNLNQIILKSIENHWNLTNPKIEDLLQNKGGRFVYKIFADEGVFIYKLSSPEKSRDAMVRDLYIFEYSLENNFHYIPKLLKTKNGESFISCKNCFAYIMQYIEGGQPKNNIKNWYKIGVIMAKLHDLVGYKYRTSFVPDAEKDHFKKVSSNVSFGKEYLKIVNKLPDFNNCSKSLIHTDVGINNVAQDKLGNLFFLDWDDVGIGITILDLGFPLICQFLDYKGNFDKENAKAFYDSYFKNRYLPAEEREIIFDAALFFALIYLPYGDVDEGWGRIQFAIKNRDEISFVVIN